SESVVVGERYQFTPQAADADGDSLTFTIGNRPTWAAFDSATGTLDGTPSSTGTHRSIVISVSDGQSTTTLPPFSIAVTAPGRNSAPTIAGSPETTVVAGTDYAFSPEAGDADGDALAFEVENAPSWASFDTATGEL